MKYAVYVLPPRTALFHWAYRKLAVEDTNMPDHLSVEADNLANALMAAREIARAHGHAFRKVGVLPWHERVGRHSGQAGCRLDATQLAGVA